MLFKATFDVTAQTIQERVLKTNVSSIEKSVEKIFNGYNTEELSNLKLTEISQYGCNLQSAKGSFSKLIKTNDKSYTTEKIPYQDIEYGNGEFNSFFGCRYSRATSSDEALRQEIPDLNSKK